MTQESLMKLNKISLVKMILKKEKIKDKIIEYCENNKEFCDRLVDIIDMLKESN